MSCIACCSETLQMLTTASSLCMLPWRHHLSFKLHTDFWGAWKRTNNSNNSEEIQGPPINTPPKSIRIRCSEYKGVVFRNNSNENRHLFGRTKTKKSICIKKKKKKKWLKMSLIVNSLIGSKLYIFFSYSNPCYFFILTINWFTCTFSFSEITDKNN